jgi:protein-disulfide isomerase
MSILQVPVFAADHIQGDPKAPVTLVEYGDYECPACGLAFPIVKAVQNHFGRRVPFVFRHFPLTQVHPRAESAAETAEFAGAHGRFWEMHDGLFENQDTLGLPLYLALAGALGLSETALSEALENGIFRPKVRADFMGGLRGGVNGTPTFFINGRRHDAPYGFNDLVAAIDAELVQVGTSCRSQSRTC